MKHPVISVICVLYNAEQTLTRCLDSILNQSFQGIELIIVNDGSTDGSASICDNYSKRYDRIKVIHTPNQGVGKARQIGREATSGEYFIYVDSDDWIESEALQLLYQSCLENKSKIAICDYRYITKNSEEIISQKPKCLNSQGLINEILEGSLLGGVCNKLISIETLESKGIKFSTGVNYCEDVLFLAEICTKNKFNISHVSKAVYNYDKSLCSSITSGSFTKQKYLSYIKFINELRLLIPNLVDSVNIQILRDLVIKTFSNKILTRKEFYRDFNKEMNYLKVMNINKLFKSLILVSAKGFYPEAYAIYRSYLKMREFI